METWADLRADTFRQYGEFTWQRLITGFLTRRSFQIIVTMRLCQCAGRSHQFERMTLPFFKFLHRVATSHAAVDSPWKTEIGPGLAITHGWGLVVSSGARIGKNVTLFHGVTLGRRDE
mgnify:CR=1 FL=1